MVDIVKTPLYDTWLETHRHSLTIEFCNETGLNPINTENFPVYFSSRCESKFRSQNQGSQDSVQTQPVAGFELKTGGDAPTPTVISDTTKGTISIDQCSKGSQDVHIELCYYGGVLLGFKKDGHYYSLKNIKVKGIDTISFGLIGIGRLRGDALISIMNYIIKGHAELPELLEQIPYMFGNDLTIAKENGEITIEYNDIKTSIPIVLANEVIDPFTYYSLS